MKLAATLEDWSIVDYTHPEHGGLWALEGLVTGHPGFPDRQLIKTTPILFFDPTTGRLRAGTKNTPYVLLYSKDYALADIRWAVGFNRQRIECTEAWWPGSWK